MTKTYKFTYHLYCLAKLPSVISKKCLIKKNIQAYILLFMWILYKHKQPNIIDIMVKILDVKFNS